MKTETQCLIISKVSKRKNRISPAQYQLRKGRNNVYKGFEWLKVIREIIGDTFMLNSDKPLLLSVDFIDAIRVGSRTIFY